MYSSEYWNQRADEARKCGDRMFWLEARKGMYILALRYTELAARAADREEKQLLACSSGHRG